MKHLILSAVLLLIVFNSGAQQLAFPTAEGYGKFSQGGRGGVVFEVTNLNDSGEGSLRAAVEAAEPRTVVFKVSGTISLESPLRIKHPYITIAGQTAPGDGICLKKNPLIIEADHVIIRYLRVRLGNESGEDTDAVSSRYTQHIILDHISASWSVDETMSIYHCDSITVQWSIISESMYNSNHVKGAHGFGGIWGSNYGTYHHNLIASHGNPKFSFSKFNIVANYYKPGPATIPGEVSYRIANPSMRKKTSDFGKWYIAGNVIEGNNKVTADNWDGGVQPQGGAQNLQFVKMEASWPSMLIHQHTAEKAFEAVLENAGATLPKRDLVDKRIVKEAKEGQASFEGESYKKNKTLADKSKKSGIIDSQKDVGGWPNLKSAPAPEDKDHDGMPDDWEKINGLDPSNAADRNNLADGYTMLEKYLNSIN